MPPTSEERLRLIIEAEITKALANVATFEKALTHMAGGVDQVNSKASQTDRLGGAFGNLGSSAANALNPINAIKGALPAIAFGSIAAGVFKTAAAFESAREQFGILLQDVEAGDKVFEDLLDFNAKTNFTQLGLNEFGVQLINAKVSTEDLIPTLTKLGDMAKGNQQKMTTMVEVFGRISLKGKADLENLNRVVEAGVPIMDTLAEVMGVSGTKIYDMVSKSQVGADAFKAAIDKLTGAGGQYNGMMAKMAENTEGKFSTAMGNIEILAGTAGESLDGMTKSGLDGFIGLTEGAISFMKAADPLIGPIGDLVGLLGGGAFKGAGEVFGIMADGLYTLSGDTNKTREAVKALDEAVAATNTTWDENLQVYRTLSEKQGRTTEETEAMRTA